METHLPRADSQGQDCQAPDCFFLPHHISFSLLLWASIGQGLGSWSVVTLPLHLSQCSLFFFLPIIGLFYSLQVIFRISCIRCAWLPSEYVEGGYHSDLLFCHLPHLSYFRILNLPQLLVNEYWMRYSFKYSVKNAVKRSIIIVVMNYKKSLLLKKMNKL